jgi:hypothetical protein
MMLAKATGLVVVEDDAKCAYGVGEGWLAEGITERIEMILGTENNIGEEETLGNIGPGITDETARLQQGTVGFAVWRRGASPEDGVDELEGQGAGHGTGEKGKQGGGSRLRAYIYRVAFREGG